MSTQIPMAYVDKYRADVKMLIQQTRSKFESYVRKESQSSRYQFFEYIGPVAAQPWGPRHGDTPLMETPHLRRRVGMSPWIWADLIDDPDRYRILIEPKGAYTRNALAAFARKKDDVIIQSMLGNAYTGHEGNTVVPFPTSQIMDGSGNAASDGGGKLTVEMLKRIKHKFWNNEVDEDEGMQLVMAVSPDSIIALLDDVKVTSADYNTVKALVQGDVDSFMGIKFIRTVRLPWAEKVAGDPTKGYVRTNLVWTPSGVLMTTGQNVKVDVDTRPDKKNAEQIMVTMDIGGTRLEEKKVMQVKTLETNTPVVPAP